MGLIKKIADTIIDELTTPKNVKRGEDFEDFVLERFPKKYYELEYRTPRYRDNKDRFIKKSRQPDFIFFHRPSRKKFAVECKNWRFFKNGKEWITEEKLNEYKEFERRKGIKTFIVIGVGEDPKDPDEMFCIPLEDIKMTKMYRRFLEKYQRPPRKAFYFNGTMLK